MTKLLFVVVAALMSASVAFSGFSSKASAEAKTSIKETNGSAAAAQADHRHGVVESISINKSDVDTGSVSGKARSQVVQVAVKLDDGEEEILTQKASVTGLAIGQHVKVIGRQIYPAQ